MVKVCYARPFDYLRSQLPDDLGIDVHIDDIMMSRQGSEEVVVNGLLRKQNSSVHCSVVIVGMISFV